MTKRATVAMLALLIACSETPADTGFALPDEPEGFEPDSSEGFEPLDTGDTVMDEVPEHTLTVRQWGTVLLSPARGPYTSFAGTLSVQEYLDGDIPPRQIEGDTDIDTDTERVPLDCELEYALDGVPSEATCPGCSSVFDVQFSLLSGDPAGCHDPDLPAHSATWTLAWHAADGQLQRDVGQSGVWQPWYRASIDDDVLTYEFLATLGVFIDDEDM